MRVHVDHNPALPPSGVLRISRDRDDRRILGGLKFSILGFFFVCFFFWRGGSWNSLASIFNLRIHGSSYVSLPHGPANKFLWLRN